MGGTESLPRGRSVSTQEQVKSKRCFSVFNIHKHLLADQLHPETKDLYNTYIYLETDWLLEKSMVCMGYRSKLTRTDYLGNAERERVKGNNF